MASRPSERSYGGAAGFPRSRRVNQLIREVVADEIERLADADERLRLLTVTEVSTAADLRNATVFLSSLPDEAAEALEERRVALQAAVGRQARMKRTPKLRFEADPAVAHGAAIDEALRRLGTDEG
jgi:ribosome-binding factor A